MTTLDLTRGGSHYKNSKIAGRECIELTHLMTFSAGNTTKYLWRAGLKDGEGYDKDLGKAQHYLSFLEAQYTPCWTGVYAPSWYSTWKAQAIREGHGSLVKIVDLMTFGLYASAGIELADLIALDKEYA